MSQAALRQTDPARPIIPASVVLSALDDGNSARDAEIQTKLGCLSSFSCLFAACMLLVSFVSRPGISSYGPIHMAHVLDQIRFDLLIYGQAYKFYIEIALVAILFYVGFTDFRTFKISNNLVLLLLVLCVLFAVVARTPSEILSDLILSGITFVVLVWFYTKGAIGGGDVKLVTVACLWTGPHCALLFSVMLLLLIGLHVFAAWMGWAKTKPKAGRFAIPYAPSIAGALIATTMLGCL
jgi:Flp pilus assembly protein protease CpaA